MRKRARISKRKKEAFKSGEPRELKKMMRVFDLKDMQELDKIVDNSSKLLRQLVKEYLKSRG